ncbi:TonB-dependent receptor domain-containing protein [Mesonia sp. HuA40]|uniref:TonB-dependent receptor n=1 Tax=Mesonia sp. HuA40 TaxID=2602761 RepID=UPI0011C73079|nr:TonB-dependent receptor [Mesonia sp. HuA40]TXK72661.1 TonB-dependent receptor [Mesonia sp. HuA40]
MKFFVQLLLFSASYFVYSQSCSFSLEGKVIDFHDGQALANAKVELLNTNQIIYTNAKGEFKFEEVCEGAQNLRVNHPDCQELIYPILIERNTKTTIYLEHHLEELEVVSLVGKINRDQTKSNPSVVVDRAVLDKHRGGSLGDALQEIAGVSSLTTGNSIVKPVIQGLHSSRVLLMQNNVRLENQDWGVEHAPSIAMQAAQEVEMVKGASALALGGDALGGAIITSPAKIPVKDTLYGYTGLVAASNGRGGGLHTQLTRSFEKGWYAQADASFKRFGDAKAPDNFLANTGHLEKALSLRGGLNKFVQGFEVYYSYYQSENGILRDAHIGNVSDLIRAINREKPLRSSGFSYKINEPKQSVTHHLAKLSYYRRLENIGKIKMHYAYQENNRLEYDIRRGDDAGKASLDLNLKTHEFQTNLQVDYDKNYDVNAGVVLTYQDNFANPLTGVKRLIPDYKQYKVGGYITGNYKWDEYWTAEAGLRFDYTHLDAQKFYLKTSWDKKGYQQDFSNIIVADFGTQYLTNPKFDFQNFSWIGGLKYEQNNFEASFNYTRGQRAPNVAELFSDGLHHSAAIIELGDLRFKPETSHKISLNLAQDLNAFSFVANPYLNRFTDFITLVPKGLETTVRGAFPVWEYEQVDALLWGIDAQANYRIARNFESQVSFAYLVGRDLDADNYLNEMPAPNFLYQLTYKRENWKDFQMTVQAKHSLRQHNYPNNNFYYEVLNEGNYEEVLVDISTPPEAYILFGFESSARFTPFNTGNLEVNFQVQNILNTQYNDYLNRLRYYAYQPGRNFILNLTYNY